MLLKQLPVHLAYSKYETNVYDLNHECSDIQPGTGTTQGRVGQGEAAGVGKRAPR